MRHQYTPIFREFTTSSMWAESPETRCVWVYLMLHADPEGFVPGTIPGLAVAANVDLTSTRHAIEKFMAPDPDSNSQAHEGRRLEKVAHGWRILNFTYWRELAKTEAEKARKRNWIRAKRNAESDDNVDTSTPVDERCQTVDAPKPKPKPKPEEDPEPAARRPIVRELGDWEPSEELRAAAGMAGVQKLDEHIARLRTGPIGGQRGVFKDELDAYIESMFGKWRAWEETDRARETRERDAAAGAPARFGKSALPVEPFEPNAAQRAFAARHGLDLDALYNGVLSEYPQSLAPPSSRVLVLGERLTVAAKQKQTGAAVTGKLTPEQFAAWGPVPVGGAMAGAA